MSDAKEKFMKDLKMLLNLHSATIWAKDHWEGYPECGQDVRMTVEFDDWGLGEIDLGSYADKNSDIKEETK